MRDRTRRVMKRVMNGGCSWALLSWHVSGTVVLQP